MYIEASAPRKTGDNAVLLSPSFAGSTQPRCLNFWYHMYGADIGAINVYVSYIIPLWKVKICVLCDQFQFFLTKQLDNLHNRNLARGTMILFIMIHVIE